jgi:hypothetical protein
MEEAVNTHSNARFGREVEWNVRGNDCFLLAPSVAKYPAVTDASAPL